MIHLIGELHVRPDQLIFDVNPEDITDSMIKLDQKEVVLEIKKKTKKRSINANNYLWMLCSLIAADIQTDKDSVYEQMLRRYGQYVDIECDSAIAPKVQSLFRVSENLMDGYEHPGKVTIRGYRGSHSYNSKEMATLINGVVSECASMGIDTWSEEEVQNLLSGWVPEK